ncbi:MAG: DUF2135 domain-containing protein [Zoogloeaceae bacterium]|jgi:uncharacterized protein YfaP (DUF2135 family)|nr:DUF2135 domain-containing protein [Zoogloeaceae bacterium]
MKIPNALFGLCLCLAAPLYAEESTPIQSPQGGWGYIGMDVDGVDGAGPEIFSAIAPLRGVYAFYVNYWGNFGSPGYHFDETPWQRPIITCRITLILHENTSHERRESFVAPLRRIGDLTHIRTLVF